MVRTIAIAISTGGFGSKLNVMTPSIRRMATMLIADQLRAFTAQLQQYLVKGFAMDDDRLKQRRQLLRRTARPHPRYPFLGARVLEEDPRHLRNKRGLRRARGGLAEFLCRNSEQDALGGTRPNCRRSGCSARRFNPAQHGADHVDRQPAAP